MKADKITDKAIADGFAKTAKELIPAATVRVQSNSTCDRLEDGTYTPCYDWYEVVIRLENKKFDVRATGLISTPQSDVAAECNAVKKSLIANLKSAKNSTALAKWMDAE